MKAVLARVLRERAGRSLAVLLDYDGTLTPIVERPEAAVLAAATRSVLRSLARRCVLAVVSGRDLEDVRARVGVRGLAYAGSHGFDIAGPGLRHQHPGAHAGASRLPGVARAIARATVAIEGVRLEPKRFALAVHYRRARQADVPKVRAAVERALARYPGLRMARGKKVFDLQPDIAWDKGRAVLWLLRTLRLERDNVLPLYIGDDLTDEDAFRALARRGIGIAVQEARRRTAARFTLRDPDEVRAFLAGLARALPAARPRRAPSR
jgi:trehalose-phosphatase